jgi:hypothetical protein
MATSPTPSGPARNASGSDTLWVEASERLPCLNARTGVAPVAQLYGSILREGIGS